MGGKGKKKNGWVVYEKRKGWVVYGKKGVGG